MFKKSNRSSNLLRKMEVVLRYIMELNRMLRYYDWVFESDPWFIARLREAKASYADLEQALRREIESFVPADESTDEKMEAIARHLM